MAFSDIFDLQFQARLASGQAVRNTLHFRRNPSAGEVDAAFLSALAGDASTTTIKNAYKGILGTTSALEGILLRATADPQDPGADRDEFFRAVDEVGTRALSGSSSPDELTTILKLSGDLAGRRFRGRLWLPPPSQQSFIVGESINTGAYRTATEAFLTEINKTMYTSAGGHYGGNWNDVDLVVFSKRGRVADETYYARVANGQLPFKLYWLRSRNPTRQ